MKVYAAISGTESDCPRVRALFTREGDAAAYELGDSVEEFELHDGPVEVRAWYQLAWTPSVPDEKSPYPHLCNPNEYRDLRDFDGNADHAEHRWEQLPTAAVLVVTGWDLGQVRQVYAEQRAQYTDRQAGTT